MSDETPAGEAIPPVVPPSSGTFDWLRESHLHSAPLAPLTDDIPSPAPAGMSGFADAPPPLPAMPTVPAAFSDPGSYWTPPPPVDAAPLAPLPGLSVPPSAPQPAAIFPSAPVAARPEPLIPRPSFMAEQSPATTVPPLIVPTVPPPGFDPAVTVQTASFPASTLTNSQPPQPPASPAQPAAAPAASSASLSFPFPDLGRPQDDSTPSPLAPNAFGAGSGVGALSLERHQQTRRSSSGPLDWAAFALAILAPPVGFLLGIVALVVDSRTKGFTTGIAKAAVAIAVVLSIGLTVGIVVYSKIANDQAQHQAIVASSVPFCTKLRSNPATLASNTYGWPAPGNTIPASIKSMQAYETYWKQLKAIAPSGIKAGAGVIESNAAQITDSVSKTQTLDDASDVSQMQQAVSQSGIAAWVSNYCN